MKEKFQGYHFLMYHCCKIQIMMRYPLILLWWCFLSINCLAQNPQLDRLMEQLNDGDPAHLAQINKELGIYWQKIYPSEALYYFRQSLDAYKKIGNREEVIHINIMMADTYLSMEEYDKQLFHLKKALQDVLDLDRPQLEISILYQIANVFFQLNNCEMAEEYSSLALQESRRHGRWMLNEIKMVQAKVEFCKGNYLISIELAKNVLANVHEKKLTQIEIDAMCHIGDCLIKLEKYDEAHTIIEKCLSVTDPEHDTLDYYKALQLMVQLDYQTEKFADAFAVQRLLEKVAERKNSLKQIQDLSEEVLQAEFSRLNAQWSSLQSTCQKQEKRESQMTYIFVLFILLACGELFFLVRFWFYFRKLKPKRIGLMEEQKLLEEKVNILSNKHQILLQNQETLKKTNSYLTALNRYKTELFEEISRDLQAPLVRLQQNLANLMTDITEDQFKQVTAGLTNMVGDVSLLLENLLQWSKYQSQGIRAKPQYTDITALVNDALDQQKYSAAEKKIVISNALQHHLFVYADEDMVKGLLKIILQNIIKLSDPNAAISLSGNLDKQYGYFQVNYTGQMPLKHIFIQQFHSDGYGAEQTEIGKAISFGWMLCRALMEANYGNIRIEDVSNESLNIILNFPLEAS